LQEELNIDLSQIPHTFLAKLTPYQHGVSAYMHVYVMSTEQEPAYNANDFISAAWFKISELQTLIKQGEPTKGDLPLLINLLQETYY
jgi:hypothetical protein